MSKAVNRKNQSRNKKLNGIITDPRLWNSSPGYEFWFVPGNDDLAVVMGSANNGLSGYGWTQSVATSGVITMTEGTDGDFLSSSDVTQNHVTGDATGTGDATLISPRIFGSYDHMLQASYFLGYMPTTLNAAFWGKASKTSCANELTFFGFASPTTTPMGGAGAVGLIGAFADVGWLFRNDTNNTAITSGGIDLLWHYFTITVGDAGTSFSVDGVSSTGLTNEPDVFPTSFVLRNGNTVVSEGSLALGALRIWYS